MKIYPADLIHYVNIGDTTYFKVWIIANPVPEQKQWHLRFFPNNSFPENVHLTVSGDVAVLNITNVTKNHYGTYSVWAMNKYGGWKESDLNFRVVETGIIDQIL